ncbi:MAG: copper chaperone PCu(A)C [Balneolaceae bacterium]|nr:copper chaperone PCu(A)C [Balneolaceae bacterium]
MIGFNFKPPAQHSMVAAALAGLLAITCSGDPKPKPGTGPEEGARNSLMVRDARVRPASRGMTTGGYLTILNRTPQTDTLVAVSTDAAGHTEIHQSFRKEGGVSGMRPAGPLPVESGSRLELKPGGYHLMLMQLSRDLAAGDSISLTLKFTGSDSLRLRIPVAID